MYLLHLGGSVQLEALRIQVGHRVVRVRHGPPLRHRRLDVVGPALARRVALLPELVAELLRVRDPVVHLRKGGHGVDLLQAPERVRLKAARTLLLALDLALERLIDLVQLLVPVVRHVVEVVDRLADLILVFFLRN